MRIILKIPVSASSLCKDSRNLLYLLSHLCWLSTDGRTNNASSVLHCYAGHRLKVISWRRQIAHVRRRVQARPGMRRLVGFGRVRVRVGRADALQPASGADCPPRLDVAPRWCSFRERKREREQEITVLTNVGWQCFSWRRSIRFRSGCNFRPLSHCCCCCCCCWWWWWWCYSTLLSCWCLL